MSNVWVKKNGKEHGEYEFIEDNTDLKNLIEITMGREVGNLVQGLIDDADYTQRKLNSDVSAYEDDIYTMRGDFQDIVELVYKLTIQLNGLKRVERKDIISQLDEIAKIARLN